MKNIKTFEGFKSLIKKIFPDPEDESTVLGIIKSLNRNTIISQSTISSYDQYEYNIDGFHIISYVDIHDRHVIYVVSVDGTQLSCREKTGMTLYYKAKDIFYKKYQKDEEDAYNKKDAKINFSDEYNEGIFNFFNKNDISKSEFESAQKQLFKNDEGPYKGSAVYVSSTGSENLRNLNHKSIEIGFISDGRNLGMSYYIKNHIHVSKIEGRYFATTDRTLLSQHLAYRNGDQISGGVYFNKFQECLDYVKLELVIMYLETILTVDKNETQSLIDDYSIISNGKLNKERLKCLFDEENIEYDPDLAIKWISQYFN